MLQLIIHWKSPNLYKERKKKKQSETMKTSHPLGTLMISNISHCIVNLIKPMIVSDFQKFKVTVHQMIASNLVKFALTK